MYLKINRRRILLGVFFFTIFCFLALIIFVFKGPTPPTKILPTPTPISITQKPVVTLFLTVSPYISARPLQLLKTDPPQGTSQTVFTAGSIRFFFSEAIDIKTLQYSITPEENVSAKAEGVVLFIYPKISWKDGVDYKITIKKGLLSLSGAELKEDVFYQHKFIVPKDYNPW